MKISVKIGLILIFIMGLANGAVANDAVLRIGVEGTYPPFSMTTPDGKLEGFDIDITDALCAHLKRKCIKVPLEFDAMIPALMSHKIDLIVASMSITKDRQRVIDFTNRYYKTPARFVGRIDAHLKDTPQGLKDKVVGVQRGTVHQDYMEMHYPDIRLKLYSSQDDVFLDLVSGRIDATLMDAVVIDDGLLKQKKGKDFAFFGKAHTDPKVYGRGVGIGLRKGEKPLKDAINQVLSTMRKDGSYKKINNKYFDFDVYGQDSDNKNVYEQDRNNKKQGA